MDGNMDGIFSQSIAFSKDAADDSVRHYGRAMMAQAVLRLANSAQANFKRDLQAELARISQKTEEDLGAIRQKFRANVLKHVSNDNDDTFVSQLLRGNADILREYHFFDEDKNKDIDLDIHDDLNAPADQGQPPSSVQGELLLPQAMNESIQHRTDSESEDNKNWLYDNHDEYRKSGTGGVSRSNPLSFTQESTFTLPPPVPSFPPSQRSQLLRRQTIVLDSDDSGEERRDIQATAANNKKPASFRSSPAKASKAQRRKSFPMHRRRRSSTPPHFHSSPPPVFSSSPRTLNHLTPSGTRTTLEFRPRDIIDPGKDKCSQKDNASYGRGSLATPPPSSQLPPSSRRQPVRRAATGVIIYNDRKNFKTRYGTLDGPEYYLTG
ncbi:hypothetical protein F4802DRAFT_13275 [Xylaria palmicola]|nr:hypothetical protein F4802DRAFT_13275 [Xylaria palmicola]